MMSACSVVPRMFPVFSRIMAGMLAVFVLMAASGCAPRKQGVQSTPLSAQTIDGAVTAYQQGNCRESIRQFRAALQQQEHPALLNGLGMAYLSCNQPKDAAQAFERAVSVAPGSAALHSNAGTALYEAGDYSGAERHFDAALRIDSSNPEALVGKAGVLIKKQQPEKALQQLSLISGADAGSPEVSYNKALALYQMGLTNDASTALSTYVQTHPNDAEAHNALGVVMLRSKNLSSAKAHLDRAIALHPEQAEYYYNRANILKEQKQFKAAIEDYTRAIAFRPELTGAYLNRGDLRFLLRETEAACMDLKKACDLGECDRLEKYEDAGRCRDFF